MAGYFYLGITNGRNFLLSALLIALGISLLAAAWFIFVHGDLKQRSDACVSIATSLTLVILAVVAKQMYEPDWSASVDCAIDPAQDACSDPLVVLRHTQNAAALQQIWSLMAFGQIIPLLSILKDAVYCWLKPTPWQSMSDEFADVRRLRRENRRRLPSAPDKSPDDLQPRLFDGQFLVVFVDQDDLAGR
ncbi:hypothetical protein [Arthrobacter sp. UYCo732]|uniref:hypothetical protein n=1 Tax=Arthrobacter sp. UYCo732 TaxID=3156336 RepID=UPI0033958B82